MNRLLTDCLLRTALRSDAAYVTCPRAGRNQAMRMKHLDIFSIVYALRVTAAKSERPHARAIAPQARGARAGNELQRRGHGSRRVFFLRHMPELLEYDQAAAGDGAMKLVRIGRRQEPVAPAPQDQGW